MILLFFNHMKFSEQTNFSDDIENIKKLENYKKTLVILHELFEFTAELA